MVRPKDVATHANKALSTPLFDIGWLRQIEVGRGTNPGMVGNCLCKKHIVTCAPLGTRGRNDQTSTYVLIGGQRLVTAHLINLHTRSMGE